MVYEPRQARRNNNFLAFGLAELSYRCLKGISRPLGAEEYTIAFLTCHRTTMMVSVRALVLILLPVAARAASSESSDQSSCVNTAGYDKCIADADAWFNTCVTDYCGGSVCVSSCKGDANCVYNNCPQAGKDCLGVCDCIHNTDRIACVAQDCWNQVRLRGSNQPTTRSDSLGCTGLYLRV